MSSENELQTWLRAMKRVPWSAAKPFLKSIAIDPSTGWHLTTKQLSSWTTDDPKYIHALNEVKKTFHAHLFVGEKLVLWYQVDPEQVESLCQLFFLMQLKASSNFSGSYPLPIDHATLVTKKDSDPELTYVEDTADHIALVYCCKRSYNAREEIIPTRFSEEDRLWLERYQHVIGYRRVEFQAYDVIFLDKKTGLLEVRIDAPEALSQDDIKTAREVVLQNFYTGLTDVATTKVPAMKPINFYPAIEKMYKAAKEGSVFELYFTATTGSNNFGKMRNKEKDLRVEAFHKAGSEKVGITPYRLGVMWHHRGRIFHPELHLPGSLKLFAFAKVQPLHIAFIRNCLSFDDYHLVQKKFFQYL